MDFRVFLETKFLTWVLLVTRLAGMFMIAPFFAEWFFPIQLKIPIVIFFSWAALPLLSESIPLNINVVNLVLAIITNYFVGFSIGFLAVLPFASLSIAGEIFGTQMGFAMSSVFDPQREETPILGEFMYVVGLYVFVALNSHLLLIQAIVDSVETVPLSKTLIEPNFVPLIVEKSSEMFVIAMKFGFPIIAFMLVVSIALGIISRLVPQMNVFMVGMPLKVLVGLILFAGMIPVWADVFSQISLRLMNFMKNFIKTF